MSLEIAWTMFSTGLEAVTLNAFQLLGSANAFIGNALPASYANARLHAGELSG
ncbi:hypothetical protein [Succinimonas sp.]|uniref:hypothetical protein n=1 Tax=Succinimonas sp. TaxID=1936151 RepID=UPI00386757B2